MEKKTKYYVVREKAVPEVLLKVVEAKRILDSERATTVQEATEQVGISRSSFYKYKDDIFPFHDQAKGRTVTFILQMDDKPGILSDILRTVAEFRGNILDPGSQSDKRRNIKGKYYRFISFFADLQNPVDQFAVPLMDAVKFSKCYHTSLIQLKIQIFCNIFHVSFHSSLCRNCFSNCFYGTKHLTEYCLQNRYASFSFR